MSEDELLPRISVDPAICFGKPCIKGHRISVSLVLDLLASGLSVQDILDNYPGLEQADIAACIVYGAEMPDDREDSTSAKPGQSFMIATVDRIDIPTRGGRNARR